MTGRGFAHGPDRPLIEHSFLHLLEPKAAKVVSKIVIITRKEKILSLKEWLLHFSNENSFKIPVGFILHQPQEGQEWPLSVLASQALWADKNLVLLPDTQLMLPGLIEIFDEGLQDFETFWGTSHRKLSDAKTFGMIRQDFEKRLFVTEKPTAPAPSMTSALVWGCFGFRKNVGATLLKSLEHSTHTHEEFQLPSPSGQIPLVGFEDLSR